MTQLVVSSDHLLEYARRWLAERLDIWRRLDLAGHGEAHRILAELLALDRILNPEATP